MYSGDPANRSAMRKLAIAAAVLLPLITGCASVDYGGSIGGLLDMILDAAPSDTSTRAGKQKMWDWENRHGPDSP